MNFRCTDTSQVVPRYSACLGLGGDHESEIKIDAKHGDMCRFNPEVISDESNYELVEGNILELCEKAVRKLGKKSRPRGTSLPEASFSVYPILSFTIPSVSRGALSSSLGAFSRRKDDNLGRQLH